MKILCAILLIFIWCSDLSAAKKEKKNPFCNKYSLPKKPVKNDAARVSVSKCEEYVWQRSTREYISNWNIICDGDSGIFQGNKTEQGDFMHMGALGWGSSPNFIFLCGSSLISPNFVVTAAHCTFDRNLKQPSIVRLGTTNIKYQTKDVLDIQIETIIKHPQYSAPKIYYDIALIKLAKRVSFSPFVQPACLWISEDLAEYQNKPTITGWGATSGLSTRSFDLLVGHVDVIDAATCSDLLYNLSNRNFNAGVMDHQICAGNVNGGSDTCVGDSGGPLQFTIENTTTTPKIHHLFGITSNGSQCGKTDKPGLYTRVSYFIDWIEKTVWPEEF